MNILGVPCASAQALSPWRVFLNELRGSPRHPISKTLIHDLMTSARARLANIERRLSLLEAERQIVGTLTGYSNAIDYGDLQGFLNCFSPAAVYELRGPRDFRYSGYSQLTTFFRGLLGGGASGMPTGNGPFSSSRHKHYVVDPTIAWMGDLAECTSYFLVVQRNNDIPTLRLFGRYRDKFEYQPDGSWRISERIIEVEAMRTNLPSLSYTEG